MNTGNPMVSVVIPVFNAERFLAQAVQSVIDQTMGDWELILVDDGSTDQSTELAEHFAACDPRIRLLRNPVNVGVSETRNRGVRAARGQFIALLDSDDRWHPEKLEKQLALEEKTGADILYCSYAIVNEAGDPCCPPMIVPEKTDLDRMLVQSTISCSTALIRRELMLHHPFGNAYAHEDLVLWLDLLSEGYQAAGCREVLADYRQMVGSRSHDKLRSAHGRWKIYREHLGLGLLHSQKLFLRYAVRGIKKYRRA